MNLPDELRTHWSKYGGNALLSEPNRLRGLLGDLFPGNKRETNLLLTALAQQVPQELLAAPASVRSVKQSQLIARLEDDAGLGQDAAFWAVEAWSLILGIVAPLRTVAQGSVSEVLQQASVASDYEASVALLEPLVAAQGKIDYNAHYDLAVGYHVLERSDDALATFRKCVILDSTRLGAYYGIATILYDRDEADAAEIVLRQAVAVFDSSNKADQGRVNRALATLLFRSGDKEAALPFLRDYYKAEPENPEAIGRYTFLLWQLGKYEDAVVVANKSLNLPEDTSDDWFPFIHIYRGLSLCRIAKPLYAEAEKSFRIAIAHPETSDGDRAFAYYWCTLALEKQSQRDDAINIAQQGLVRYPNDVEISDLHKELIVRKYQIEQIIKFDKEDSYDQALPFAEAYYSYDNEQGDGVYWYVYMLCETDNYTDSVAVSDQGLLLGEDKLGAWFPSIHLYRGLSLYKLDRYVEAEKSFRVAITHPKSTDSYRAFAYRWCAGALEKQNRHDEAMSMVGQGLTKYPNHAVLNDTHKELTSAGQGCMLILFTIGSVAGLGASAGFWLHNAFH